MRLDCRSLGALVALLGCAASARAMTPAMTPATPTAPVAATPARDPTIPLVIDEGARMTVPVQLGDSRDYHFLVDTGAEVSGIADDLAAQLSLSVKGRRDVVSFGRREDVPTVGLPPLQFARERSERLEALRFDRRAIGADGYLGLDALRDRQIDIDFQRDQMNVRKASIRGLAPKRDAVLVRAGTRRGHLVFTETVIDKIRAETMIDTGSSLTVGNRALRDALMKRGKLSKTTPVYLMAITGEIIRADYGIARSVKIGDVVIRHLPLAFAEVEPFAHLDMADRPALLLGMDALSVFGAVSLDFRNRTVRFAARDERRATGVVFRGVGMIDEAR